MKPPPDIETTLRAQRWRGPPPGFLDRVLDVALEESKSRPWPFALLAFIPRPLRLPLAACWLLALFFRLTTPEAVPQGTLDALAQLPTPPTPAQLLAHLEQAERLAHELFEQLRGPLPPL